MKPKQLFFVMIGILLATIASSGAVYYFAKGNLDTSIQKISERTAELENFDEKARTRNEIQAVIKDLEERQILSKATKLLPSSKSQAEAIQKLYDVFQSSNLSLDTITFNSSGSRLGQTSQSEATGIDGVLALPITLAFDSSMPYSQAKQLILSLQDSSRHITITNLQVNAAQNNQVNVSLSVSIQFQGSSNGGEAGQTTTDSKEGTSSGGQQ